MSKITVTTIAGLTSGGDANTVKIESGDDFVVDTNVLKVDATNNRVGIGVTSPSRKLELNNGGTGFLATLTDGVATNFSFKTDGNQVGTFGTEAGSTHLGFMASGTERVRIHSGGVMSVSNGIELGSGLDATAANVLDDYEEGTWTPSCGTPGVSGSYSVQLGRYIKVGQFCHLIFNLTINSAYTGSTSSSFTIGGLPFATKAYDNSLYAGGHIGYYFNINHTDSGRTLVYQIPSGSSLTMELKGVGDNIGEQSVTPAMMGSSAVIRGSISYHTV